MTTHSDTTCGWCGGEGAIRAPDGKLGKDCPRCKGTTKLVTAPAQTWQCEYCGKFYSERTAATHAYCQQAQDRRDAESVWRDV